MQQLAPQLAPDHGLASADYRDVISALNKNQLVSPAILTHRESRLKEIDAIIRNQPILTLSKRKARIRLATDAERAAIPAPNMHLPRLLGNTGEIGEFVPPLRVPDKSGAMEQFDDFMFAAASWTLTAHEARPGHELQFASIVEQGVSDARVTFAFSRTNFEGLGLYAERLIESYEPSEGRLICLQHRLMRALRAFLDIELQSGKITREQALATLKNDVVLSERRWPTTKSSVAHSRHAARPMRISMAIPDCESSARRSKTRWTVGSALRPFAISSSHREFCLRAC
jgi:hypothetical protein